MNSSNQRGQSLIEFIVAVPFLFILLYAVIEFSLLFVQQQRVSALSRQLTSAAFYDCANKDSSKINACLDTALNKVDAAANVILPDFDSRGTLIVSAFDANLAPLGSPRKSGQIADETRYPNGPGPLSTQGVVVIGEAFFQYQPLTPIQTLLVLLQLPTKLYESTIF